MFFCCCCSCCFVLFCFVLLLDSKKQPNAGFYLKTTCDLVTFFLLTHGQARDQGGEPLEGWGRHLCISIRFFGGPKLGKPKQDMESNLEKEAKEDED